MGATRAFAEFVAGLSLAQIPDDARRAARMLMLDTVGVALAAAREPVTRIITGLATEPRSRKEATIWGQRARTDAMLAALANGTIGHALDYDDMSMSLYGHPSVPVLPAALALGEAACASGAQVMEAYVAGVEVESKLGNAVNPTHYGRGWHATVTLGTLGAAAAAGKVLGLDAGGIARAMSLAASMAAGLKRQFGTMAKPFHPGHAAMSGVLAARLAHRGMTAEEDILEGTGGFVEMYAEGDQAALDSAAASLGAPFALVDPGVGMKPYPSCGSSHESIDAVLAMVGQFRLRVEDIAEVRCGLDYLRPKSLIRDVPRTGLEGKFSLPFCIAMALLEGGVRLEHFTDAKVNDPAVKAVMAKVHSYVHPEMADRSTTRRGVYVTIRMRDGTEHTRYQEHAKGSPRNPLTMEELRAKFRDCCAGVLTPEAAEQARRMFERFEGLKDVRTLMRVVSGTPTRRRAAAIV